MDKASAHHPPDVKVYMLVFGALMIGTVLTVLVSYWHLPKLPAILIALMIATTKASLVAAFFMHLKGERALIYGLLGLTIFFMVVLFALPITDSAATGVTRLPSAMGAAPPAAEASPAPAPEQHVP